MKKGDLCALNISNQIFIPVEVREMDRSILEKALLAMYGILVATLVILVMRWTIFQFFDSLVK